MISCMRADVLLADKGCDSDAAVALAESLGMQAVIPPRSSRKKPRAFDAARYRAGHLVENLFQRMKMFRRVATRDGKHRPDAHGICPDCRHHEVDPLTLGSGLWPAVRSFLMGLSS